MKKMKAKLETIIGIVIACAVLITMLLYITKAGELQIEEYILIIIPVLLVASAIYILWDRIKNIKAGLPAKDERLIKVNYKAGYYGFIAAIWSAVFVPLTTEILFGYELIGGHVTAAVVIISGLVFMISYLCLSGRGNIE